MAKIHVLGHSPTLPPRSTAGQTRHRLQLLAAALGNEATALRRSPRSLLRFLTTGPGLELYRYASTHLERYFQKHTTRSSIGFTSVFNGSRKAVISLIPSESTASDGVRFQLYSLRLRTWLNLPEDADLAMLPPRRTSWIYYETAGPDYEGFQGVFANRAEIDCFIDGLARSPKTGTT